MILWRIVFCRHRSMPTQHFDHGPWHPDKAFVEHWAAWFRRLGHQASIEDNQSVRRHSG
jgi:hypothetical protein